MIFSRCLMIALVAALCAGGFLGCSKKENEPSASVSVALKDDTKELPRLEQNFIYEKSVEEEVGEPFYFHESPDPLVPLSEEKQKKEPAPSTV